MIALILAAQVGSTTLRLRESEYADKIRPIYTAELFESYAGASCGVGSPYVQDQLDVDLRAAELKWSKYFGLTGHQLRQSDRHMLAEIMSNDISQYQCYQFTDSLKLDALSMDAKLYAPKPHS